MKTNNVHIICFPPHTTHILQPVDRGFFCSLKHNWNIEGRVFTRENGGQKLQKTLSLGILSKAWKSAATPENARAGFRGSRIHPLDTARIDKCLFAPSLTTDREEAAAAAAAENPDTEEMEHVFIPQLDTPLASTFGPIHTADMIPPDPSNMSRSRQVSMSLLHCLPMHAPLPAR